MITKIFLVISRNTCTMWILPLYFLLQSLLMRRDAKTVQVSQQKNYLELSLTTKFGYLVTCGVSASSDNIVYFPSNKTLGFLTPSIIIEGLNKCQRRGSQRLKSNRNI